MKTVSYLPFILLLIFQISCIPEKSKEREIALIYKQIYEQINSIYPDSLPNTIFYIETAVCLSCEEKFWNFYSTFEKPLPVIQQIDNSRVPIRKIVPEYVTDISMIMPFHSNSISKSLDNLADRDNGVSACFLTRGFS